MRAYLDAQQQYAAKDRNGDDVREYAQKIASTPGKQDGLYWPADESKGEETSPFGLDRLRRRLPEGAHRW